MLVRTQPQHPEKDKKLDETALLEALKSEDFAKARKILEDCEGCKPDSFQRGPTNFIAYQLVNLYRYTEPEKAMRICNEFKDRYWPNWVNL